MSLGRVGAATRRSGSTAGCRSRSPTSSSTDVLVLVGSNLAETMPPAARHLDRLRERGGKVVVIDPRRTRPPSAPTCSSSRCPAPIWPWRSASCTCWTPAAQSTRSTSPRAPQASTTSAARSRRGGPSGSSASPGSRPSSCGAGRASRRGRQGHGADRPGSRAAQPGHATRPGLDQRRPRARHARQAACRLRLPDRAGQRPGRSRARAEGRPAARLPDDRRSGRPRRTWPGSGAWRRRACLARAARPTSCSTRSAPTGARRRCSCFGSNIVVSAPNATHVSERLAALDLLVVADIVLSETAAMADVVLPVTQWAEETGTMTNLEGRVILRQQAATPAGRRPQRPRRDRRPGRAARVDVGLPTDPEEVVRRAGAGLRGRPRRLQRHHLRPDPRRARRVLALSGRRAPGHAAALRRRVRHTDGRARFVAVEHVGAAEQPDADYPLHLTTGRVLAQYQSGAQTRRIAGTDATTARSSSCTRCWRHGSEPATASPSSSRPVAAS